MLTERKIMGREHFRYVIIGAGLAGASAVRGIRESDKDGSILMIGNESYRPYNRPPLTKDLWSGKKRVEDIFVDHETFYKDNDVVLKTGNSVKSIDSFSKSILTERNGKYTFEKLLLASGGIPRRLSVPGGDLEGICYFRYLDDYLRLCCEGGDGRSILVIGGGFIGSELTASLHTAGFETTLLFPERYICNRVFSQQLGLTVQQKFTDRGIAIHSEDKPVSIIKKNGGYLTTTAKGIDLQSDIVIAGIGISPETALASGADLMVANGIVVNDMLECSIPGMYAAGDNALFPYSALDRKVRVEHWDNALNQGLTAGRNLTGRNIRYDYMPYFFSDLFDFGYEAVGDTNPELTIAYDWKKEGDTGAVYYLHESRIAGVMMCNIYGKMDEARALIKGKVMIDPADAAGLISFD